MKIILQQHKRWHYTWISPDGQYWNQIDYILCSWRWRSSIQSAKNRPGADCGSDHELLIAKFTLKLKKIGKPLDHSGVTKIPYNYTVEVTNRFKGLDMIECQKIYGQGLWQEAVIKTIFKKNKCKKAKCVSDEALQMAEKRREAKSKGEKEWYIHLNAEFQRISKPS